MPCFVRPGPGVFILPTVTMLYQTSPADEQTPIGDVPAHLRSAIVGEQEAERADRSWQARNCSCGSAGYTVRAPSG